MANNSAIVNSNQQQFQQPNSAHHCKECGLFFDSAKSLEVHLQYHKENLLNKWANQASQDQETNNNNTAAQKQQIKREFNHNSSTHIGGGTIAAAADSSDSMLVKSSNKSPDSYSRTTPETSTTSFGHPPTPQSYHSAPSPYQSHGSEGQNQATFSPGYQGQQYVKSERASPAGHYQSGYPLMYDQQYFNIEQQLSYPQDYPVHKMPNQQQGSFRYHPYQHYERSSQVSSSSPAYPTQGTQPTPSPSPKQCDKCGCVCDSASQLVEHLNHAHPPTPHLQNHSQYQGAPAQQFTFKQDGKTGEEEPQTEILDLDSHKVHHVFQTPEEEEELKRNGDMAHGNPHSVSAMLGTTWPNHSPSQKMFSPGPSPGPTPPAASQPPQGIFGLPAPDQKHQMFQMHPNEYIVQAGSVPSQELLVPGQYRPFEHLPPQPTPPVISSSGVNGGPTPAVSSKGANWKSNEARRPKTYNCSACNKWFTSSGHLKRHYNTTLHKNAVKSSGQPDPATMPISAHHHPGRDERSSSRNSGVPPSGPDSGNHSPDSADNTTGGDDGGLSPAAVYDRSGGLQLQQPPSGPYDRQPQLNLGPGPPLGGPPGQNPNPITNLSSGSPPNGEAGPSASQQDHLSRGLLSISTNTQHQVTNSQLSPMDNSLCSTNMHHQQQAFSLYQPPNQHMMGTTPLHSPQNTSNSLTHQPFHQMHSMPNYPNGSAPHVTPTTATISNQPVSTSLTITGDQYTELYGLPMYHTSDQHQPLPSFAQFQSAHHRYGILLAAPPQYSGGAALHPANVGGMGPVTDPIFQQQHIINTSCNAAVSLQQSPDENSTYDLSPSSGYGSPAYRQLTAAAAEDDYEITVLEAAAHDLPYSPPNHNNNQQQPEMITTVKLSPSPTPPALVAIKSEPKHDYEHGSPQITSTGSPLSTNKASTGPNGPHKCFDCDKIFNKACYLTQHNKTFHSGDKPFKCHRCGKRFPSDPSYQEHLAKHAGEKPYKCELCPKQFNHKTDLRRHMCLHTGQKPYACEHCGKGFIRKDHMLKHAETHSRKTHHSSKQHQAAAAN